MNTWKPGTGRRPVNKPTFDKISFEELIQFCIEQEDKAVQLYDTLASQAADQIVQARFESLAWMERGHVKKLQELDVERFFETVPKQVPDLKVTDFMEPIEPGQNLATDKALILAAQRERAARELYQNLAERYADEPFLNAFFTMMAEEEAGHKHDLESEYDRRVQGEL